MACFELYCLSPVLTQNEGILNFDGSLILNKRKTNLTFWKCLVCHCVKHDSF